MGKKLPTTPRSRVRAALRQLWLRSRERASAVKREHNTCQRCSKKGSVAKGKEVKINVHHTKGICNWDAVIDHIFKEILCNPAALEVLCVECHDKEHHKTP